MRQRAELIDESLGERADVAAHVRHPDLVEEVESVDHRAEGEEVDRAVLERVGAVAQQV